MTQRPHDDTAIGLVSFASPEYELCRIFREKILRKPLGRKLSEVDLAGEDAQIHIAARAPAGDVVGTVLLRPDGGGVAVLRQMAVDASRQGQGLGRLLVEFAEKTARERGFTAIRMKARVSALGFYTKLGYAADGEPHTDELQIPSVYMMKPL